MNQDIYKTQYEAICIDDGSTDESGNILDDYKTKYPNMVVIHTENRGVVLARSKGMELAKGKYIWFIDGDDWIRENCLKYLCDAVLEGDNDLLLFREKRVTSYTYPNDSELNCMPQYFKGGYKVFDSHYTTGSGFYWFRKSVLDEYNIRFRPDIYYSDDTLFIAKFKSRCKRMVITEAQIYFYYQRNDSVSHSVNYSLHCGCMYKLAQEYRMLSKQKYTYFDGSNTNERMRKASLRAMQACVRNIVLFCKDKTFLVDFLKMAKKEKLYPFGIDWAQLKVDRKQNRKNDILNWAFAFSSFEPYLWLTWYIFTPIRAKRGIVTFNVADFMIRDI